MQSLSKGGYIVAESGGGGGLRALIVHYNNTYAVRPQPI